MCTYLHTLKLQTVTIKSMINAPESPIIIGKGHREFDLQMTLFLEKKKVEKRNLRKYDKANLVKLPPSRCRQLLPKHIPVHFDGADEEGPAEHDQCRAVKQTVLVLEARNTVFIQSSLQQLALTSGRTLSNLSYYSSLSLEDSGGDEPVRQRGIIFRGFNLFSSHDVIREH